MSQPAKSAPLQGPTSEQPAQERSEPTSDIGQKQHTFPFLRGGNPKHPVILLLPGIPQTPAMLEPLAHILIDAQFRVLCPYLSDPLRHKRLKHRQTYPFSSHVQDLLSDINVEQVQSFDIIGVGMGGGLGWALAAREPARVRSLMSIQYPHPLAVTALLPRVAQDATREDLMQALKLCDPGAIAAHWQAEKYRKLRQLFGSSGLSKSEMDPYVYGVKEHNPPARVLAWNKQLLQGEVSGAAPLAVPWLRIASEPKDGPNKALQSLIGAELVSPGPGGNAHYLLETSLDVLTPLILSHLCSIPRSRKV